MLMGLVTRGKRLRAFSDVSVILVKAARRIALVFLETKKATTL